MMDELRDYRFYAEDMLSQSSCHRLYMETFQGNEYFRNRICNYGRSKMSKSLSHKPFNPDSESHQKFEAKLKDKITALVSKHSFMKF
jgi:hypothetical protein